MLNVVSKQRLEETERPKESVGREGGRVNEFQLRWILKLLFYRIHQQPNFGNPNFS